MPASKSLYFSPSRFKCCHANPACLSPRLSTVGQSGFGAIILSNSCCDMLPDGPLDSYSCAGILPVDATFAVVSGRMQGRPNWSGTGPVHPK
eukprot:6480398-Amphidinium_carterae.1